MAEKPNCASDRAVQPEAFTENEIKDVLTALYQDGHVDLVLADRIAALMHGSGVEDAERDTPTGPDTTRGVTTTPSNDEGSRVTRLRQGHRDQQCDDQPDRARARDGRRNLAGGAELAHAAVEDQTDDENRASHARQDDGH